MLPLTILLTLTTLLPVQALYFYLDGTTQKCFFEELPKDTLVVGHYKAEQYSEQTRSYGANPDMGIFISVDEVFDNDHRIVSQRGSSSGRFTFSAADSGDHRICFTPTGVSAASGWLTNGQPTGGIKMTLDLVIGETSAIESTDKAKIGDLVTKVRDLNARLQDIRREQVFQRVCRIRACYESEGIERRELNADRVRQEREAEFRDQSESTNSRVVRWTLIQLAVLGVTCAWQLSHLRAFFIKQKLT
ncbi:emp24p/erv25p-related protein [Elasticomyces elasticus]|nr:emp24p/erv25p-related protein [Elasticomyces elasticus]